MNVLERYAAEIAATDMLDPVDVNPVLLGLFGEVGGIMATSKKHIREKSAYPGYKRAAEEEFGDTLWYLSALCRRLDFALSDVISEGASRHGMRSAGQQGRSTSSGSAKADSTSAVDTALFRLGCSAAALLDGRPDRKRVVIFAADYLLALAAAGLDLVEVVEGNLRKASGAFLEPSPESLMALDFDALFEKEEQLPREFRIRIKQRSSGKSYLQWNGVFIGDALTDSIADPDGYRFHDVFHLAHAAVLHWSPVMRALIRQKRKSRPECDEAQDGGRAIVVEEGLTAWIFAKAKELEYFANHERVSLGILKTIGEFVTGYEVAKCPLKLWERSILQGYAVFREIKKSDGGWIVGDRAKRTISYEPLGATT